MSNPHFEIGWGTTALQLVGKDDHGNDFRLTLDRVWVMNLVVEAEDWLAGTQRDLFRVDL